MAASWQRRFDVWVVLAAVAAIAGVGLQLLTSGWHVAGLVLVWAAWLIFALEATIMLTLSPTPRRWAGHHVFELIIIPIACPVWAVLAYDVMLVELVPALTIVDTVKLVKLFKSARVLRRRFRNRAWQRGTVATVAVGIRVILL